MRNIVDYVENEFHLFSEKKFNPVDSLILSQVSNFEFGELVGNLDKLKPSLTFKDLLKAEYFNKMLDCLISPTLNKSLLFALCASPRFRNIKINFYVNQVDVKCEKQFAAVTFILDNKTAYIAFRGTDDSLIGWKEDFNMAFVSPVPSQIEGTKYVNKVASIIPHYLYVGGHSKGGNIAVYSSIYCSRQIRNRILTVFSHDGPGFREDVINSTEFNKVKSKINKTLPHSSIVGMLLENHEVYKVVKCSGLGIMQHNPYSWDIVELDFNYVNDISNTSKYFNKTLNQWLSNISDEKRKLFVESLYDVLNSTNVNGFSELSNNWKIYLPIILDSIKNMDSEIKTMILESLKELRNLYIKNLYPVEKLSRISIPSKPVITNKLGIRKYSKKKSYCTVKIKRN